MMLSTSMRQESERAMRRRSFNAVLTILLTLSIIFSAHAATLHVGPQSEFKVPSAAAKAARDGDTIAIEASEYRGDVAVWTANRLKIIGTGGRPHLKAEGRAAEAKAICVIRGNDTLVENIEFSGAKVPDRNGAGIRLEGRNLVLRNDFFHDNETGVLTGVNPSSEVLIEHCEFANNRKGEGLSHNVYIGAIGKLTVKQSYLHHAITGHNLKSRAVINVISGNRIADETDGRASYVVEFPNGGQVLMTSNVIQKGDGAENRAMISYGAEGLKTGPHRFIARGHTFISQRSGNTRFINLAQDVESVEFNGNMFAGNGSLPDVAGLKENNVVQREMPGNLNWKP